MGSLSSGRGESRSSTPLLVGKVAPLRGTTAAVSGVSAALSAPSGGAPSRSGRSRALDSNDLDIQVSWHNRRPRWQAATRPAGNEHKAAHGRASGPRWASGGATGYRKAGAMLDL